MTPRRYRSVPLLAAVALALLAAACAATERDEPARSPLGEGRTARGLAIPASPPGVPATPPVATLTPVTTTTPASLPLDAEATTGRATSLLAEWLGLPQRELAVAGVEAVTWPDTCLGIAFPDRRCDPASISGYRLRFEDVRGGKHTMRASADAVLWAGESPVTRGTLIGFDPASRILTLRSEGDRRELSFRAAPGTHWGADPRDLLGRPVALRADPAPNAAAPTVAWIALDAE